jgi:hypothetical protein
MRVADPIADLAAIGEARREARRRIEAGVPIESELFDRRMAGSP